MRFQWVEWHGPFFLCYRKPNKKINLNKSIPEGKAPSLLATFLTWPAEVFKRAGGIHQFSERHHPDARRYTLATYAEVTGYRYRMLDSEISTPNSSAPGAGSWKLIDIQHLEARIIAFKNSGTISLIKAISERKTPLILATFSKPGGESFNHVSGTGCRLLDRRY